MHLEDQCYYCRNMLINVAHSIYHKQCIFESGLTRADPQDAITPIFTTLRANIPTQRYRTRREKEVVIPPINWSRVFNICKLRLPTDTHELLMQDCRLQGCQWFWSHVFPVLIKHLRDFQDVSPCDQHLYITILEFYTKTMLCAIIDLHTDESFNLGFHILKRRSPQVHSFKKTKKIPEEFS